MAFQATTATHDEEFVFVYGTLKRGYYNYNTYFRDAIDQKNAFFIGNGSTVDAYRLVVAGDRFVPFLLDVCRNNDATRGGNRVEGEVYKLTSPFVLEGLDILEGVHVGFYYRTRIDIQMEERQRLSCWTYFKKSVAEQSLELPCISNYTLDVHQKYRPISADTNPSITRLMQQNP